MIEKDHASYSFLGAAASMVPVEKELFHWPISTIDVPS